MTIAMRTDKVSVENLFLDPNNYRLLGHSSHRADQVVRADKIASEKNQRDACTLLLDDFDARQLTHSLRKNGFLPDKPLVVSELSEPGTFVVIEGNRRLAAVKSVLEDIDDRGDEVPSDIEHTLRRLPVMIMQGTDEAQKRRDALIAQGISHLSGPKPWGPYERAKFVEDLRGAGWEYGEIARTLGMRTSDVQQLHRAFGAFSQMRDDPDFGDRATADKFSYFAEALKKPKITQWLRWSEQDNRFVDAQNLAMFHEWIAGTEVDGSAITPRINRAIDVRSLADLMDSEPHFLQFRDDRQVSLEDAKLRMRMDTAPPPDWRNALQGALKTLKQSVPAGDLEGASGKDVELIGEVRRRCDGILRMINSAQGVGTEH